MSVEQRGLRHNARVHSGALTHEARATDAAAQTTKPVIHVVEDDRGMRASLVRLLESAGFATRQYGSAAEFLIADRDSEPGCIVLDVGLPGLSGMELQAALVRAGDSTPVVFLTGHGDVEMGVQAMKAGAVDFLTKPVRRKALMAAMETALARDARTRFHNEELRTVRERYERLTPREREVFARVVAGKLNKQIAGELGTSERTIKAHRAQVMSKMEATSLVELVRMAEMLSAQDAA